MNIWLERTAAGSWYALSLAGDVSFRLLRQYMYIPDGWGKRINRPLYQEGTQRGFFMKRKG
jgi:hypothetical protein